MRINGRVDITADQAREIRRLRHEGKSLKQIGLALGKSYAWAWVLSKQLRLPPPPGPRRGRMTAAEAMQKSYVSNYKTEHRATVYRDGEVYQVRIVDDPARGRRIVRVVA